MRRVPMAVMGSTEESEVPGIGAAAQRIRRDVVYLDQVLRATASSGLSIDVAAAAAVPLPDLPFHRRRDRAARSARLRRRSDGAGRFRLLRNKQNQAVSGTKLKPS
ncbi:MAG: hypothetical protein OXJ90_01315, partial [Spirochaetaceae bacterium]|nr:hypothetical protein [Spirochaetaceae bacterium]